VLAECDLTAAAFTAPLVPLPLKSTFVTEPRFWPLSFAVEPPWMRCFGAQSLTHATLATLGCGA
jgi:hypothetical protein